MCYRRCSSAAVLVFLIVPLLPGCNDIVVSAPSADAASPTPNPSPTPRFDGAPPTHHGFRLNVEPIPFYDEVSTPDHGFWTADDEIQGRSCPMVIYREVTGSVVLGGGEVARFGFRGRKPRLRYAVVPGSTLPAADYSHPYDEFSDDARWIATMGGTVMIWRCLGRFYRLPGLRIWKGTYWMYAYDGEIRAGPNYQGPQDGSCGGGGGAGNGSGGETELIEHIRYDPYDPMASFSTGTSGSGCTGGSGTQYEPGDHTGGETVDWGTGIGNGGASACGGAAMVEYVCIDVYDAETGFWEEWGCGYVTTC